MLTLFALTELALVAVFLPLLIKASFHTAAFWIALTLFFALSAFAFLIFFKSTSIVLLPSRPPVVVTTTTWFGKYISTREETLEGAAWVSVSRNLGGDAEPPHFSVEIVQPGRWATVTSTHDDTRDGLELAKKKCAELAALLGLKDMGYRG